MKASRTIVILFLSFGLSFLSLGAQQVASSADSFDEDRIIQPNTENQSAGELASTMAPDMPSTSVVIIYIIILGALCFVGWRLLKGGSVALNKGRGTNGIHVTETKMLGNKQHLIVVECDDQRMLLGVGPGFINHLCFLDGTTQPVAPDDSIPLPDLLDEKGSPESGGQG